MTHATSGTPLLESPKLSVELDRRISFAMQQNDVPVIKTLRIDNPAVEPLRDLELLVSAEPEFAEPWLTRLVSLAAGASHTVPDVDLQLSPRFLGELTEGVRGCLRFKLAAAGIPIAEWVELVDLFARDEWTGLSSLPEILAAFVLPNHPAVESILRMAADTLGHWTGDPSLSGYQSRDPKRAYVTTAAIYAALQGLGLSYINPPASFEASGQRIRLPDRILESRLATCLDLAVLAAACIEQAGLHPLIAVVRGHAFAGAWLLEECFAEPAVPDALRLRKRVELDEIVVFDPTLVTTRSTPDLSFERSVQEAQRRLADPEEFHCVIDVRRARKGQIRPLPERVAPTSAPAAEVGTDDGAPSAPDLSHLRLPSVPSEGAPQREETPAGRIDRWKRKLLDLTLRNRLLNFRETKKTIPLLCPEIIVLEDSLADGAAFQILPKPRDLAPGDPRDAEAHRRRTGEEGLDALLREEMRAKRLYSSLTPEELERRLLEIYRAARAALEEGGASALYLAVGFLKWYETPESAEARVAPIVLLPLELQRRSTREGFALRLSDDEPRLNITLLELLKQDHGVVVPGLDPFDPLPQDESGIDVGRVLRTFRGAVRDIDRWNVQEDVHIGFFSFTKFLMWRDLETRANDLLKNAIVDHLVNRPNEAFDGGAVFAAEDQLDEKRPPNSTFCPLPTDSSQLAAVISAADGRSFVLEGPPGTGKSQTITNLIAHCLAEGKTVLFVSEKMAALGVVYDRLRKVGLGRYCLELHSNKTHKRDVIAQLGEAMDRSARRSREEWEREAARLATLRNELNAYVGALHRRRRSGESVFQATSRLIGLRDVPRVPLRWESPDTLGIDDMVLLRDQVDRLATAGAAVGEVNGHPWQAAQRLEWTPGWEEQIRSAMVQLESAIEEFAATAAEAASATGMDGDSLSLADLRLLDEICSLLVEAPSPPPALLLRPEWDDIHESITGWIEHGRRRDTLRAEVLQRYDPKITTLDLDDLRARLERASGSWWPLSWLRRRWVRRALREVAKDRKAPPRDFLSPAIEQARSLRDEERALAGAGDEARALLGRYWRDSDAEWDGLEGIREWAGRMRSVAVRTAAGDLGRALRLREGWARLASEGRELLHQDGRIGRQLRTYKRTHETFLTARSLLSELLDLDEPRAWGRVDDVDALGLTRRRLRSWSTRTTELRDWCAWRRARSDSCAARLGPLIELYESGSVGSSDLRKVFERSYYQWWHDAIAEAEPVLSRFFSPEHERQIEQFRNTDERYLQLTRELIVARLAERVPAAGASAIPSSEIGILQREIAKKKRHMAVRQVLQSMPNLLPILKPCLLMSPISVAQYLDPSYPRFDLVVFDEASQIPVWDAVGAIARGKQAVIVGDPKQLPPTSFFERTEEEEEGSASADSPEDLESILDDCMGARIPWLPLNWHYRSRHESLIAFSNHHYYNNRLLTFPSPQREGMGISWRQVPGGVYDKGKSRTNRAEADAVVAEIVRRLKDSSLKRYSIGVVTFSEAQQTLVEDLLEPIRREDPELDAFFSEEAVERVFVKNLENVQGDERDVILFSVCYGPDAQGHVSMNFGPMNRDGGERRLNVAITRARREVVIFSTLRAEQIDLARTRARGVRDLKSFLEYAERGPTSIFRETRYDPDADFDSPFEEAVYDALARKGWEVHKQVGCSRYRIDLAVVDQDSPGRYLLGVECDGANYHRARTARDRDKLREGILRDLGWELHRIWSTDWWTNPSREIEKLDAALKRAKASRRESPADTTVGARSERESTQAQIKSPAPLSAALQAATRPPSALVEEQFLAYAPFPVDRDLGDTRDFYEPSNHLPIRELIAQVVATEGPISLGLTARRVGSFWGLERVHEKAVDHVRNLVPRDRVLIEDSGEGAFLWSAKQDPATFDAFRVPSTDPGSFRDPDDLPVEEVENAALMLVRRNAALPLQDLVRETSRLFGFQRTGANVERRIRAGIRRLEKAGLVRISGDTVALVT